MFRGRRKVKPEDNNESSSSSDSEGISSLAYALRRSKNSKISRICDNREIEFIEKRFQDTSRVIFQEVDEMNRLLLRKSYKAVFRSDIVTIGRKNLRPRTPSTQHHPLSNKNSNMQPVTIDHVWDSHITNTSNGHKTNISNNAVYPEVRSSPNDRRKGICRIT